MNKNDRNKLATAGFTILRIHESPDLKITQMTSEHSWANYGKYESKAAMYREVTRVNEHEPKMIFD